MFPLESVSIGVEEAEYGAKSYARTDEYEIAVSTPEQFREFESKM